MHKKRTLTAIATCLTHLRKILEIFKHIERKANVERLDIVFNEIGTPPQHREYISNLYSRTYDIVNAFYENGSERREQWQDHGVALFKLNARASIENKESLEAMAWRFSGTAHRFIDLGLFQCCTDYKSRGVAAPPGLQRYILIDKPDLLIDNVLVVQPEFAKSVAPDTWAIYENLRTLYPEDCSEVRSQWSALVGNLMKSQNSQLDAPSALPDDFAPG